MKTFLLILLGLALGTPLYAHTHHEGKVYQLPTDCGDMEVWDVTTAMCLPFATGHKMTHLMVHGNIFGTAIAQSGPRGEDGIVSTQMVMGNIGTTWGERHFLNLGLMATGEKWTMSAKGYPLLLQTGEANHLDMPFIDAQHPHSSPIMGITLSDTIRLGDPDDKDFLRIFFAPRGSSTDGPITFMHRPTGVVNPDAPLGHHTGQDVGHITSTVMGVSLKWGETQLDASAFSGAEPEPEKVDLPIHSPNSGSLRLTEFLSENHFVMASIAYVKAPHDHAGGTTPTYDDDITSLFRYSASLYSHFWLGEGWEANNIFIYGSTRTYGVDITRHSLSHEIALQHGPSLIFTRTEVLQRVPAELNIAAADPLNPHWVAAFTLGYSHLLKDFEAMQLRFGGSVTKSLLPSDFKPAYDGNPWSGKIFLQLSGMEMWML